MPRRFDRQRRLRRERQGKACFRIGFGELLDDAFQRLRLGALRGFHFGQDQREQMPRFFKFQFDRLVGLQLLLHVIDQRSEVVAPRDHREFMTAEPIQRNVRRPQVVAERQDRHHLRFVPVGFIGGAPLHGSCDLVVAFRENRGRDLSRFAHDPLRRKAPVIDRRRHAFDRHPRPQQSLVHRLLVGGLGAALDLRLRQQDRRFGGATQQVHFAGLQQEGFERQRCFRRVLADSPEPREVPRRTVQQMARIDINRRGEIGVQHDQRCFARDPQIRAAAAQDGGVRRARAGQRAQFAGARQCGGVALQGVRMCHFRRHVEARPVFGAPEFFRAAVVVRERLRDTVFEAHWHKQAGAYARRCVQRAPVGTLDQRRIAGIGEIMQQARAVRFLGKRNGRRDAKQRGVFVEEPVALEIPPSRR